MVLLKELLKTTFVWFVIVILLILMVLFPRTVEYQTSEEGKTLPVFVFNWEEYEANISDFIVETWEAKSLGQTRLNMSAEEEIKRHMSRSMYIIITALFISLTLGIVKGIYDFRSEKRKRSWFGKWTTWLFQSIPDYFIITCLAWGALLLLKFGLPHLPLYNHENWYSFIIPSIILAIYPAMYIATITANSLHTQEDQLYLRTARAKGLSERVVIYKHALANCWIIVLSHCASVMLYILSGLIIVEYFLFYRGAAYRLFEALGNTVSLSPEFSLNDPLEIGLIIGFFISFSFLLFVTKIISKTAQFYLDPREGSV